MRSSSRTVARMTAVSAATRISASGGAPRKLDERGEVRERLGEVGLALPVAPEHRRDPVLEIELSRRVVPKVDQLQPSRRSRPNVPAVELCGSTHDDRHTESLPQRLHRDCCGSATRRPSTGPCQQRAASVARSERRRPARSSVTARGRASRGTGIRRGRRRAARPASSGRASTA